MGLELGGKDPAYVRADADLEHAIDNIVDGAFFNSGQSCCGVERIYVDAALYDRFVEGAVALTRRYVLGDPTDPATTLGPMVRTGAADFVRKQTAEAVGRGARALIDEASFAASRAGTPYLAAADPGWRRSCHAGDERGKFRAGRGHHEGVRATRRPWR